MPRSLTEALSAHLAARFVPGEHVLWNEWGRQRPLDRAARRSGAREALAERDAEASAEGRKVDVVGLPEGLRFHDYADLRVMPTSASKPW